MPRARRARRPAATASRSSSRLMLSSSRRSAPASSAACTSASSAHSTSTVTPSGASAHALVRAASPTPPASRAWFSFTSTASNRPSRWFSPPPALTASLLELAQPRRGLARVEDPRAGALHGAHEASGERGDPRQVAEEVERHALPGQDRAGRARDLGHAAVLAPGALVHARGSSEARGPRARTPPPPPPAPRSRPAAFCSTRARATASAGTTAWLVRSPSTHVLGERSVDQVAHLAPFVA